MSYLSRLLQQQLGMSRAPDMPAPSEDLVDSVAKALNPIRSHAIVPPNEQELGLAASQGGALDLSSQYQAAYDKMVIKPVADVAVAQDVAVKTLVAASIWPKIKGIFFQTPNNEQASTLNFKDPIDNTLVKKLSISYDDVLGFKGNSADSSYMEMDFNPSADGDSIYTNDEASIFAFVNTEVGEDHTFLFGNSGGGTPTVPATGIIRRYRTWQGKVNEGSAGYGEFNMSGRNRGFIGFVRTDNDTLKSYFNGHLQRTQTGLANGTALLDDQFQAFRNANTGGNESDNGMGCLGYGGLLTDSDMAIMYNVVYTYLSYINALNDNWHTDYAINFNFETDDLDGRGLFNDITGSPDYQYTTSPLSGTKSMAIHNGDSADLGFPKYGETTKISFMLRWPANPSLTVNLLRFVNQATQLGLFQVNSSGRLLLVHGSNNGFTDALAANTIYYIWLEYTKGTGANGVAKLYYSTDTTQPETAQVIITDGTSTLDMDKMRFLSGSDLGTYLIDNLKVEY